MNVFIVEDDANYRDSLVKMLSGAFNYTVSGTADNYTDALIQIRNFKPNVVICDYHLKGELSGLDLFHKLKEENFPVLLISEDGAESSYAKISNIKGISFLVKPFHKFSLISALENLLYQFPPSDEPNQIIINSGSVASIVDFNEILWIESDRNYSSIIISNKKYVVRSSFKKLITELEDLNLVKIHKRYAVPMKKIKSVNFSKSLVSLGSIDLPFGRTYTKSLRSIFGRVNKGNQVLLNKKK
ncbi:MAG: response regulator transcription factor [Saprospiraceae bacterium]|nr:response regulator transcription factor [Saprospiraceae bacterium]